MAIAIPSLKRTPDDYDPDANLQDTPAAEVPDVPQGTPDQLDGLDPWSEDYPGKNPIVPWVWDTGADVQKTEVPPPNNGGNGGNGGDGKLQKMEDPNPKTQAPDNSGLNALIAQLLDSQKSRDSMSAQQYADQQAFRKNILDTVNGIIGRNSGTASAEDPVIASQVTAFKGQGEQAMRQARESQAARTRATGSATGELDSSIAGSFDTLGKNTGAFSAGLVGSENTARRNALQGAASLGAGIIGQDQNTALQDKIATLNSALSAAQTQGNQAIDWATLLQRPELASIAAGPGNSSAGAQWANVNNQNSQFYDKFTYDQAQNDQVTNLLAQLLLSGA